MSPAGVYASIYLLHTIPILFFTLIEQVACAKTFSLFAAVRVAKLLLFSNRIV
jgi:hypothetical protein